MDMQKKYVNQQTTSASNSAELQAKVNAYGQAQYGLNSGDAAVLATSANASVFESIGGAIGSEGNVRSESLQQYKDWHQENSASHGLSSDNDLVEQKFNRLWDSGSLGDTAQGNLTPITQLNEYSQTNLKATNNIANYQQQLDTLEENPEVKPVKAKETPNGHNTNGSIHPDNPNVTH